MATVITRAFEHWQAGQVLNNLPARPDTIIFAHVPGLDPAADINPDEGIPADGQIVHRDVVAQYGMINDSAVAYSVVLDTRVGDFTFNWIGLVDAASNTLCMIVHTPAQQKIATANGVQGNNITRTFLMEFAGAAEAAKSPYRRKRGRLILVPGCAVLMRFAVWQIWIITVMPPFSVTVFQ